MSDSAELARRVQNLLNSYVKREVALDVLQDALEDLAPDLAELADDKYAPWAVDHAEILIAELFRAHRSEDEVRNLIRDEILLPMVEVVDASAALNVTATDSGTTSNVSYAVAA